MKSFLARQRGRLRQARAIAAARGGWFRCAARALRIFYLHGWDGLRLAWRAGGSGPQMSLSAALAKNEELEKNLLVCARWLAARPEVLRYRFFYHEISGIIAPYPTLPKTFPWPHPGQNLSYKEKLTRDLPVIDGRGVEIGPLNIPILNKEEADVIYVDHLDQAGLAKKYPHLKEEIVAIDYIDVDSDLTRTLSRRAPFDYIIASQVLEHLPNPIAWLNQISGILVSGGLLGLSLPLRSETFDLIRPENSASDLLAAYFNQAAIHPPERIFDHYSSVLAVNTPYITTESLTPDEIFKAGGALRPPHIPKDHYREYCLDKIKQAQSGEYLDAHAWVFTDWSFLLLMAELTEYGFITQFRLKQFYPPSGHDRGASSFIAILEKTEENCEARRKSFLMPLVKTRSDGGG